jgi:hypothetical protein
MRMKLLSVKLGVALIGLAIFGYAELWGADWKLYMENDLGGWFYDTETITRPSKNTVRVWGKTVYTDKGVNRRVTDMRVISEKYRVIYEKYKDSESEGLSLKYKDLESKYKDFGYEQNLIEFNCADRKSRTLKGTAYSRDGSVLSTYTPETPDWNDVMTGTVGEALYKMVCNQEESKESKDNLSHFQYEKPTTGANMIVRIGEYYLGQDIKSISGLVEFTHEEYTVFQSYPGWFNLPGEKIFKAPDVTFNRHLWYLTVGSLNGKIYILALQYINNDRALADNVFEETLKFIKSQMGTPTEQTKAPDRYVWDSTDGNVLLGKREAMGFWSINFLITGKKGKGAFK